MSCTRTQSMRINPRPSTSTAWQVATCWLSQSLRERLPGHMPGRSLHQALTGPQWCRHLNAAHNTSPKWSSWCTMTSAQQEPPQIPRGFNPLQCPATLPARDTCSDDATMDRGHYTPTNSRWGSGRTTAPVVAPHVQVLPVQLPSCLAQPNLPGGQFHMRPTPLTTPGPNSTNWDQLPPRLL